MGADETKTPPRLTNGKDRKIKTQKAEEKERWGALRQQTRETTNQPPGGQKGEEGGQASAKTGEQNTSVRPMNTTGGVLPVHKKRSK